MEKNRWRSWLLEYCSFSLRERWALVVLVLLIVTVWLLPQYLSVGRPALVLEDSLLTRMAQDLDKETRADQGFPNQSLSIESAPQLRQPFLFDPNTVQREDWIKLGVPARVTSSILRYREKGGRFRRPEDIKKIYGLQAALAMRLLPYIIIAPDKNRAYDPGRGRSNHSRTSDTNSWKNNRSNVASRSFPGQWKKKITPVAINTADSLQWEALPGIGPSLAGRILKFRERLGGFYAVGQVREVYGIEDSVFLKIEPYLQVDQVPVKQVSLNDATKEEMAGHPYFRWKIAQAIVAFRQQHGPFVDLEELKEIHLISEDQFRKMVPYCKIR